MSPVAIGAGLLPVLLFLGGLLLMDSFKLVPRRDVARAILAGVIAAAIAFAANVALLRVAHLPPAVLKRYVAPVLEEALKAAYVVWLVRRHRVGFMVDAGITGFAVGAGFAVVENLYYAAALADPNPALWIVRGLGTAVMHGCTSAIAGIVVKDQVDRHAAHSLRWTWPGIALAAAIHAAYNHLALSPLAGLFAILLGMPLLLVVVFERSERATRDWLGHGFDSDAAMLEQIASGTITDTPTGAYLESLRERFPDGSVADMLCLLQLHAELSMRAKGVLIARAAGVELPADPEIAATFREMRHLERTIGPTGLLAILPLRRRGRRELWELSLLRNA